MTDRFKNSNKSTHPDDLKEAADALRKVLEGFRFQFDHMDVEVALEDVMNDLDSFTEGL